MSLKRLQKEAGIIDDGIFGRNTFKHCSAYLGITDNNCAVHFWAQVAHETGMFKYFSENLNYSTKGLLLVFEKYFPNYDEASKYARKPSAIASKVYANRMGNGNELSGDGWKFRGRGALQLTGHDNYVAFSKYIKDIGVMREPQAVSDKYAFQSAMFFFDTNNLWDIACIDTSENTVKKLTKRINGGYNGLEHRIDLTKKYSKYSL